MKTTPVQFIYLLLFTFSCLFVNAQESVSVQVNLNDAESHAVENAVIIFTPTFSAPAVSEQNQTPAIMNQIDKQFAPHVLVVQAGRFIAFPNADNLFHHVYSFSPAKQFELKLYKEFTAEPLRFDEPGIVDIGCNIHDWMLGYIVVTESPYFIKTDTHGKAQIDLPAGEYALSFWHPRAKDATPFSQDTMVFDTSKTLSLQLDTVIENDLGFDDGFGEY